MRLTSLPAAIVVCILGVLPCARAQSPATQPTTQPADELAANSPLRGWFKQLADPDPRIRDKAKIDLMGIRAEDLPKLRQLVIENQPISPAQSAALHDIVVQAFLADDKYEIAGGETDASGSGPTYFLGLLWPTPDDEQARLGVSVDVRLPGFPAFRFLRKGDMILGIYFDPEAQFPDVQTHTQASVREAILGRPDAQKVVLQVLRDGEQIKVDVRMAPKPSFPAGEPIDAIIRFNAERVDRADAYWEANFAPLLEAKIDASNLAEGP
jgi:hypothetical protein